MTATPTRDAAADVVEPSADASAAPPRRRPWWKSWRMILALLIILPTFIGQIVGTDDAWPFAPFRMFASPTRRTTSIVYPEFEGTFASGRSARMYSGDFFLRRAEVESELNPHHSLPRSYLADMAGVYNHRHRKDPLVELDLLNVGQALVDGRPGRKIDQVVQNWKAS